MSHVEKKQKVKDNTRVILIHPKSKKWYELTNDELGSGGYGSVFKGKTQTGQDAAIKIYDLSVMHHEDVMREYTVQKYLNDNRVKGIGQIIDSPFEVSSPIDMKQIDYYTVMELIHGVTLHDFIESTRTKTWTSKEALNMSNKLLDFMRQLALIVQQIHKKGVVHYDIKPTNIMIQNDQLVLIDFGLACFQKDCKSLTKEMKKFVCEPRNTTEGYTPPEIADRKVNAEDYDFRLVDIYSLGKVFVDIATDTFSHNRSTKFQKELHTKCDLPEEFKTNNDVLNHIIETMIMVPYTTRPDIDIVISMLHGLKLEKPFPTFTTVNVNTLPIDVVKFALATIKEFSADGELDRIDPFFKNLKKSIVMDITEGVARERLNFILTLCSNGHFDAAYDLLKTW